MNPHFSSSADELEIEIRTDAEADEFRSHVEKKQNQRWTRHAVERNAGVIPAWRNGGRTDESCSRLTDKLSKFSITRYYTDNWKSHSKYIPSSKHIIGKADTWRTERKNLNFRTHIKRLNRKTTCFSKSEKIHDNVIGMYINRYYFEHGRYSESA